MTIAKYRHNRMNGVMNYKMLYSKNKKSRTEEEIAVSVIVPFFNSEGTLSRCIESLLKQSFTNFEIVLIDDGSTDDSAEIAKRFAAEDTRIKLLSQDNSGQAKARNAGIDAAEGRYICFVDSDDYVDYEYLSSALSALQKSGCEIVAFNFMKVVNGVSEPEFDTSGDVSFDRVHALAELNYHRRFDSSAGGKVFPRSYFENVRFPPGMKCEDAAIMHLLIAQCSSMLYISKPLYYYERNAGSTTRSERPSRDFVDDALNAIRARRQYYLDNYPELIGPMNIESLLSIIYAYGRFTILGGVFSRQETEQMLGEARSYLLACLLDSNIPNNRKLQAVLFCLSPRVYTKLYAIMSMRRGY